jgi:hypothetical protein
MPEPNYALNPNPLVKYLKKPVAEFTRADIIDYIENNGIKMVNFRYAGGDGRLKVLNFVIQAANIWKPSCPLANGSMAAVCSTSWQLIPATCT